MNVIPLQVEPSTLFNLGIAANKYGVGLFLVRQESLPKHHRRFRVCGSAFSDRLSFNELGKMTDEIYRNLSLFAEGKPITVNFYCPNRLVSVWMDVEFPIPLIKKPVDLEVREMLPCVMAMINDSRVIAEEESLRDISDNILYCKPDRDGLVSPEVEAIGLAMAEADYQEYLAVADRV